MKVQDEATVVIRKMMEREETQMIRRWKDLGVDILG